MKSKKLNTAIRLLTSSIALLFIINCLSTSSAEKTHSTLDFKSNDHYKAGNESLDEKKYEEAIIHFDKAINDLPQCVDCYVLRGYAYHRLWISARTIPYKRGWSMVSKRPEHPAEKYRKQAMEDAETAIKMDPNDFRPYYMRALINLELKNGTDDAIDNFNKVLELNPKMKAAHCLRGLAWDLLGNEQRLEKKNEQKARDFYTRALNDYISSLNTDDLLCQRRLEQEHCATMGDLDLAIKYYSKITELYPENEKAYFLLELAYSDKNDFKASVSLINRTKTLNKDKIDNYNDLARCSIEKGEYLRAMDYLKLAFDTEKDEKQLVDSMLLRAKARYGTGDYSDALADCKRLLEINSEDFYAKSLIRKIKEKIAVEKQ